MSESTNAPRPDDASSDPAAQDPDADPDMLNPRDLIDEGEYGGADPDADPGMLNPRST